MRNEIDILILALHVYLDEGEKSFPGGNLIRLALYKFCDVLYDSLPWLEDL
jgi:hypothetical protein